MNVIHINEGTKIPYSVNGTSICFDDDLSLNLEKRVEDWPVHIDICYDATKALVIGASVGRRYVAQLDLPVRQYTGEHEPIPLNMDDVTLTLWSID